MKTSKRIISPNKLLRSKWTAVAPINKEKHFIVTKLIEPEIPDNQIELIELEALYSRRTRLMPWHDLNESNIWRQGWV